MVEVPFQEVSMSEPREFCEGEGLLRGARRISRFIFGTEEEWRAVYSMARDLPIFRIAGTITARPQSLARAITEHEQARCRPQASSDLAPPPARSKNARGKHNKKRRRHA
jgi:hypothetical protein